MPPSVRAACSKSAAACSVSGSWKSCLAQSGDSVNVSQPCPPGRPQLILSMSLSQQGLLFLQYMACIAEHIHPELVSSL